MYQESQKDRETTTWIHEGRCGNRNLHEDPPFSPWKDVEANQVCAPQSSQDAEA